MPTAEPPPSRRALVIMGVSGSGKSSVGAKLAQRLGLAFVDGDDLHPSANVAKMSHGEALTDEDRWPWLERVGATLADRTSYPAGVAVACSALRRRYRDHIRAVTGDVDLRFLFLDITVAVARARLEHRPGHFMPASLVLSQFETLERPQPDEVDVVTVEEDFGLDETVDRAAEALHSQDRVVSR